ncbi:MAG: glycoside hydrolase family 113, partial [bacterium]
MHGLPLAWLLAACVAAAIPLGCVDPGGLAELSPEEGAPSEPRRVVVVLSGEAAELESELRGGWAFRAVLPRLPPGEWEMEIETGSGLPSPDEADVVIAAAVLPLPDELRALVRDLPVELGGEELVFAGTRYSEPSMELALRLPGPEERWLVTGASRRALVRATNRTLARVVQDFYASRSFAEGERPGDHDLVDYELQSRPWRTRSGRWTGPVEDGRYAVDPEAERDDFAARERWRDALDPVGSGAVRLLAPPAEDGAAELGELAAALARAAVAMAPEVPLEAGGLRARPVDVALESDHVEQLRHADALGLAVPGSGGRAPDLHVVLRPEDRWAYRHAVARVLLERSGVAHGRPPWLVAGAALWLAGEAEEPGAASWYGRPFRDWLPDLAAAGVLPEADVLLDSEGPPGRGDGSAVLWTPAAAAVVERLPGDTVEEKLALADRAAVERALTAVEHAVAAGSGSGRAAHRGAGPAASRESPAPGSASLPSRFLRGVSFAMSNSVEGGYHAPAIGERLDELATLGADAVSLMPFAYQARPDAPELRFLNGSPRSETDAGLIHAAHQAHRRGFTVLWKPHIWVGGGSWPGEIAMTSEADWQAWWRTYRRYVLHHAVLAAHAGAEIFAVGVEL